MARQAKRKDPSSGQPIEALGQQPSADISAYEKERENNIKSNKKRSKEVGVDAVKPSEELNPNGESKGASSSRKKNKTSAKEVPVEAPEGGAGEVRRGSRTRKEVDYLSEGTSSFGAEALGAGLQHGKRVRLEALASGRYCSSP
jgi:hypothetical protein